MFILLDSVVLELFDLACQLGLLARDDEAALLQHVQEIFGQVEGVVRASAKFGLLHAWLEELLEIVERDLLHVDGLLGSRGLCLGWYILLRRRVNLLSL